MSSKLPPFLPLEFGKCFKGRTDHLFHLSLCFFLLGSWPLKCCFSQPKTLQVLHPSATALCVGRLWTPSLVPVTGMQSAGGECAGEVVLPHSSPIPGISARQSAWLLQLLDSFKQIQKLCAAPPTVNAGWACQKWEEGTSVFLQRSPTWTHKPCFAFPVWCLFTGLSPGP